MTEPTETALSEKQVSFRDEKLRYKLLLGKFRVIRVEKNALGLAFAIDLGQGAKMVVQGTTAMDVREGDLLTLYTEVLAANAQPSTPSEQ